MRSQKWFLVITILGLSVMNTGCGSSSRNTGEFEVYIHDFEKAFEKYHGVQVFVDHITFERGTLEKNQLAVCKRGVGDPKIIVNNHYWDSLSPVTKRIVAFHECGHCLLKRKHNNNRGHGRQWESLMEQHPQQMTDFEAHEDEYLKELFHSAVVTPDVS